MTTKPLVRQEQGPDDLLDGPVGESRLQGEERAATSLSSPSRVRKAPKAEPEEDFDVLEPEALQEGQELSIMEIIDATGADSWESAAVASQCTLGESEEAVTELERASQKLSSQLQTGEEPEKLGDQCEADAVPPPLSALHCETEAFSSIEGEVGEWISDAEAMSDHTEDLASFDSQCSPDWMKPPQLTEPVFHGESTTCEKMMADPTTAEETQLNHQPDGISASQTENNMSKPAHHFPSDSDNSDDVNIVSSPPFADESEEEQELIDIMSCHDQLDATDIWSEDLLPAYSDGVSVPTDQELSSALPASASARQQEELLLRTRYDFAPRGEKQEAAQQVLGQGSPPLSTVAMEPSNEGGAASHGSGCVVAVGERHGWAGERTEGENEQTGGEEGQKDDKLGGEEPEGQKHGEELLRGSQTARTRELKRDKSTCSESRQHRRHTRMEKDLWDENQSDSGVSADFSPNSTTEGTQGDLSTETPIEREIRRAIERENSLRRSRGLLNPSGTSEYVEIPLRKAVVTQSQTGKSERDQDKDRELAGKMMQHEIQEEAQREQDLVKLGKIPGVYDKGTVRQMKEKKHIFEAFQAPSDPTVTISARSKTPSWSSASDVSNVENSSSQASNIGGSSMERKLIPTQSSNSAKGGVLPNSASRGPGFSEGTGIQVVILENDLSVPAHKCYNARPAPSAATVVDSGKPHISPFTEREEEEEDDEVAPKENPFFKLRSSTNLVKVQQDIQETHAREKELRKQRRSLYGSSGRPKGEGGGGSSNGMEGKGLTSSSPLNGVHDVPGSSFEEGTGLSAAHQSVGKLCVKPPTQAEDEKTYQPEVPPPPWSPRQKTPLVQRWESGLINGHNTEDD